MVQRIAIILCFLSISRGQEEYDDNWGNYDGEQESIFIGDPPKEIKLNKYYNLAELEVLLHDLEENHGDVVKVTSLGKSAVDKTDIWAVQISHNVREERELLKPMFKYVANMHGDETVCYALMVGYSNLDTFFLSTCIISEFI